MKISTWNCRKLQSNTYDTILLSQTRKYPLKKGYSQGSGLLFTAQSQNDLNNFIVALWSYLDNL